MYQGGFIAHRSQRRSREHLGQGLLEAVNVVLDQSLLVVEVLCLHQAHQRQVAASKKREGGTGGTRGRGRGIVSKRASKPKHDENN